MRPDKVDRDMKKSHCLRNCIIVSVVLLVLLIGAIFGGAFFAYDKFAKPILKISLPEAFDVVTSLGKYKEKDIVTNPYTEEDRVQFYKNLEAATCLDLPEDFMISTVVNELLKEQAGANPEGGQPVDPMPPAPMMALAGEEGTTPPPPPENPLGGLGSFTTNSAVLDKILKETGFDFSSLKENGEGKDLVVTDKQFAAVLNEVLTNLDMQQIKDIEAQLGIAIKDLVQITQVTISGTPTLEKMLTTEAGYTTYDIPLADESAPVVDPLRKDIEFALVLCVNVKENIPAILASAGMPEALGSIAKMLLPDKIYVGAAVYPYDGTRAPKIFINNIKDKVMDNLLTAVGGIMEQQGSEQTVDDMMAQITNMVAGTIKTMEDMVGELTFVDSSLKMDPIAVLMTALGVNEKGGDPTTFVTRQNFFTMLKHIYHSDNEAASEDIEAYINKEIGAENRISQADYENCINGIASAYAIETTPEFNMGTWTPEDFMNKYGEIPQHIDVVHFMENGKHIYDMTQEELAAKTTFTDNAVGYMLDELIKSQLKDGIAGLPFEISVLSFNLYEPADLAGELRLQLAAGVATDKILESIGQDAVLYKLMTSIIPKNLFLSVDVPMSKGAGPAGLIINFVGKDEAGRDATAEAFDTLYKIIKAFNAETGEMVKLENLLAKLQEMVDQMLVAINDALANAGTKPSPEPNPDTPAMAEEQLGGSAFPISLTENGLKLPTVYDIIRGLSGDMTITTSDVQLALQGLYSSTPSDAPASTVVDAFIADELEAKLHLVNNTDASGNKEINGTNVFDVIKTLGTKVQTEGVGSVIDARGLINDPATDVNSFTIQLTAEELAAIVNSSGMLGEVGNGLPYTDIKATAESKIYMDTDGAYYMKLIVKGTLAPTALGEAPMGLKYENLLPNEMYIGAIVKMTNNNGIYETSILINDITKDSKNTLDKIMQGFVKNDPNGANMSFAAIETMIGEKISEALVSIKSAGQDIEFEGDCINAMNIYELIYDMVLKDKLGADATKINAQNVMDIFREVLSDPDTLPNIETADLNAPDGFVHRELETKMLVNNLSINGDDIMGSLQTLTEATDIFENIDPGKLWTENLDTVDKMELAITEAEMNGLFHQEMPKHAIAGLPAIFKDIVFEGMVIKGEDVISIVMSVDIDNVVTGPSDEFLQIKPFLPSKMVLTATIDFNNAANASLSINNLTAANRDKADIILKAMSPEGQESFDMHTIATKMNEQINTSLATANASGMGLKFMPGTVEGEGYVQAIDIASGEGFSIYTVMRKSSPNINSITDTQKIHNVLRDIFAPIEEQNKAIINPDMTPPAGADTIVPTYGPEGISANVTDYFITHKLFTGDVVNQTTGATIGKIVQSAILTGAGLEKARSVYGNSIVPSGQGMMISLRVNTSSFSFGASGLPGIVPENLTVTLIFDIPKAAAGEMTADGDITLTPFINNMKSEEMETLRTMIGEGSNFISSMTDDINREVLGASVNVGPLTLTLKDMLCSGSTTYENLYTGTPTGVFGQLKLSISTGGLPPITP